MGRSAGVLSAGKTMVKVSNAKRKAGLKKPSRRKYNDEEKKELARLRSQNRYYKKRIARLSNINVSFTITMEMIRPSLGVLSSDSPFLKYCADKDDYTSRDLIEWMTTEGDTDLIPEAIKAYNSAKPGAAMALSDDGVILSQDTLDKIRAYNSDVKANDSRINEIKAQAADRKNQELLAYMQEKQSIKDTKNLLQAISKGKIALDALSDPELAAIRYMKTSIINSIYDSIDFDKIPSEYVPIIKRTIYAGIMENPVQGLRDALRGVASLKAAQKYGNEAGDLAAGMMDFATSVLTGKPNVKVAAKTVFEYMVNKTPLNRELMGEISKDLIETGKSTSNEENSKMFARDVVVDIAKDVILSGGNVVAAAPKIVKDIIVDAGQAELRKIKNDKAKDKEEEKKRKEEIKKAKQNAGNVNMDEILAKFSS